MKELYASKRFAHFPLEIDMTKSSTILTRRRMWHVGAGLAAFAAVVPLLDPTSAQAPDASPGNTGSLNGNGFYRFKIAGRVVNMRSQIIGAEQAMNSRIPIQVRYEFPKL
jgi:hypothetical protein